MKAQKPVRVGAQQAKGDAHALEVRVFARDIAESYCTQPRCEFNGKPAQQGVCYTNRGEALDWGRVDLLEKRIEDELAVFRKKYTGKKYIEWLEAMYTCAQLNWSIGLDETIRLRREVALIRIRLPLWKTTSNKRRRK